MSRKKPVPEDILKLADEYCRAQLEIMDGTAENGIKRIGTERFETRTFCCVVDAVVPCGPVLVLTIFSAKKDYPRIIL